MKVVTITCKNIHIKLFLVTITSKQTILQKKNRFLIIVSLPCILKKKRNEKNFKFFVHDIVYINCKNSTNQVIFLFLFVYLLLQN